jgi:hypothetical protein
MNGKYIYHPTYSSNLGGMKLRFVINLYKSQTHKTFRQQSLPSSKGFMFRHRNKTLDDNNSHNDVNIYPTLKNINIILRFQNIKHK